MCGADIVNHLPKYAAKLKKNGDDGPPQACHESTPGADRSWPSGYTIRFFNGTRKLNISGKRKLNTLGMRWSVHTGCRGFRNGMARDPVIPFRNRCGRATPCWSLLAITMGFLLRLSI